MNNAEKIHALAIAADNALTSFDARWEGRHVSAAALEAATLARQESDAAVAALEGACRAAKMTESKKSFGSVWEGRPGTVEIKTHATYSGADFVSAAKKKAVAKDKAAWARAGAHERNY
jgi:hypothetical protein